MSGTEPPTITAASPPPSWFQKRIMNPVVRSVLKSPLHGVCSDFLTLLTVTGRKSGTEYTFPVTYEQVDDVVYVTTHGSNWWKNLRRPAEVELRLRGDRRTGTGKVVEDPSEVASYLKSFLHRHGVGRARIVELQIRGDEMPPDSEIEEVATDINVVKIELEPR